MGRWEPGPAATSGNDIYFGTAAAEIVDGLAGNDTMFGGGGDDSLFGNDGNDVLIDGGGNNLYDGGVGADAVSYFEATSGVTVDLAINIAQNTFGAGTDTLISVEGVRDSNFSDTFFGSDRTDVGENWDISGGNDFVDGRGGIDQVRFEFASAAVTVSLATTAAQDIGNGLGLKTLRNIENLSGSAFDDTIMGDANRNTINGRSGSDSVAGGGGADLLFGELGDDTLSGGTGFDTLFGGDGDDILRGGNSLPTDPSAFDFRAEFLIGGAGNDTLIGGEVGADDPLDNDWASYFDAPAGVVVSLAIAGPQNTIGAGIDTLVGIEALSGSRFNDRLTGNAASNGFFGDLGDDIINGGGGLDIIALTGVTVAATIDLRITGPQTIADQGNDTLISIEGIFGTERGDRFIGNGADNVLSGLSGDDDLAGLGGGDALFGGDGDDTLNGGAGNDTLDGGAGVNTASYQGGGGVTIDLNITGIGQATGGQGTDTLSNIRHLIGSNGGDTLIGDASANRIEGRGGADSITAGGGNDTVLGGGGNDTVSGGGGEDLIQGENGADSLSGGADNDRIEALGGNDVVDGDYGDDVLLGGLGGDTINGGVGNDQITGGAGRDVLTGGPGADRFIYAAASESPRGAGARDVILDFSSVAGDKIDLSAIDGNAGAAGFQNILASQLSFAPVAGGYVVSIDVLGTPGIDMAIEVRTPSPLTATDFIL